MHAATQMIAIAIAIVEVTTSLKKVLNLNIYIDHIQKCQSL